MVLQAGAYFAARAPEKEGRQIVREVVIRFAMPDPEARYHIPLILAPHSYAVWWSS
jgi:5-hydroxyisourate hydrolase